MKKLTWFLVMGLAACASPDEQLLAQNGVPDAVLDRLLEGVETSAVGLESGCYLYDAADGSVVFVTDESGDRICVE